MKLLVGLFAVLVAGPLFAAEDATDSKANGSSATQRATDGGNPPKTLDESAGAGDTTTSNEAAASGEVRSSGAPTEGEDGSTSPSPEGEPKATRPPPTRSGATTPSNKPNARTLPLFAISGTRGQLASPNCESDDREIQPHYARQVAQYRRLESNTTGSSGPLPPLAFHLGDASVPGALGRYLLSQGKKGAERLARLLAHVPFSAFGVGIQELRLTGPELAAFAEGANAAGLPLQAANLECTNARTNPLCEVLNSQGRGLRTVKRGDLSIGILTVLDPSITDRAASRLADGIELSAPADAAREALEEAGGSDSFDLVVVQYRGSETTTIRAPVQFARSVSAVDLVLTGRQLEAGSSNDGTKQIDYVVTPETGAYVYSVPQNHRRATVANLEMKRTPEGHWSLAGLETLDASSPEPAGEVVSSLKEVSTELCRAWGKPVLTGTGLTEPFDRSDFITFALNSARFSTHSEIALATDTVFREDTIYPIEGKLTYADLHTAISADTQLATVVVPGSKLTKLEGKLGSTLRAAGLTVDGGSLKVNGRPLAPDRKYRVTVNRRLATGSDGLLGGGFFAEPSVYRPGWAGGTPDLTAVLMHYLHSKRLQRRLQTDGGKNLSPTASFPNLYRRPLWTLIGSLTASYNRVTVDNSSNYDRSQLSVKQTDQIKGDGTFELNADARNHGWDNKLKLQYTTARIGSGSEEFEESEDLIRGKTRYKYAGFRANAEGAWWVPKPTVEGQVESEFSSPAGRNWRKLELTGIAGATFQLFDPFELKLGFNARGDANDPKGEVTTGLTIAYTLARTDLFPVLNSPVKFESEAEYYYNDPGDKKIQELRASGRIYYSLLEQFYFTTSFSAFAFKTAKVDPYGVNTELTFGINYFWKYAIQSF